MSKNPPRILPCLGARVKLRFQFYDHDNVTGVVVAKHVIIPACWMVKCDQGGRVHTVMCFEMIVLELPA